MISKDGKLIILDDIIVNKNYSKAKRLKSMNVGNRFISNFNTYTNAYNSSYDPDSVTPEELYNGRLIRD